jgi:hypothetical protein
VVPLPLMRGEQAAGLVFDAVISLSQAALINFDQMLEHN